MKIPSLKGTAFLALSPAMETSLKQNNLRLSVKESIESSKLLLGAKEFGSRRMFWCLEV